MLTYSVSFKKASARASNYRNIFSPRKHYVCPKSSSGELNCPSDPAGLLSWQYYKEGDALHWTYFVPHDVPGLIGLFPSATEFDTALTTYFNDHIAYNDKLGSAEPNPYYWAGNEHNMLTPWMFAFNSGVKGSCVKTQYWSRYVTDHHFSTQPNGIPG